MRADRIECFTRPARRARTSRWWGILSAIPFVACSSEATGPTMSLANCSLPLESFTDGGVDRSSIPALTNPRVAKRLNAPEVGYILFSDQVIGLQFNGQPLAIPLKVLWYHEVLNFDVPGERLTVTYSPLTGSVRAFNPAPAGVDDFDVSSYILNNNLVMEDGSGTLFPQMASTATCGPRDGAQLARVPYEMMTYVAWLSVFQDTWVVSRVTGHDFLYTLYPYGDYRNADNPSLFYPLSSPLDTRRPPKERLIGVPVGTGGVAFPLPVLARLAAEDQAGEQPVFVWAASALAGGEPIVAFWNSMAQNARVYRARVAGQPLTFEVVDGQRRDVETGSVWNFDGQAVAGPLDGERLAPHPEAYHAFWFAWAEFHPDTEIWAPTVTLDRVVDLETLQATTLSLDPELARR